VQTNVYALMRELSGPRQAVHETDRIIGRFVSRDTILLNRCYRCGDRGGLRGPAKMRISPESRRRQREEHEQTLTNHGLGIESIPQLDPTPLTAPGARAPAHKMSSGSLLGMYQ